MSSKPLLMRKNFGIIAQKFSKPVVHLSDNFEVCIICMLNRKRLFRISHIINVFDKLDWKNREKIARHNERNHIVLKNSLKVNRRAAIPVVSESARSRLSWRRLIETVDPANESIFW